MTSGGRPKGIFYGWYMVGASWAINTLVAPVGALGIALYFNPIRTEMGWSAAATSLAFSLRQAETGILSPAIGFFIDRLGARKMMLTGLFLLGLGFILLGRVQSLWQFYSVLLLISMGLSIGYMQAISAAMVNWFRRHRVRALGLVYTGGSIGGILLPVLAVLVTSVGWRTTATISGLAIWAWCLPLAALVRPRPEPYGLAPDGDSPIPETMATTQASGHGGTPVASTTPSSLSGLDVRAAVRTRAFWILTLCQAAYSLSTSMVLSVHLIPFLESMDIPRTRAASMITIFMISTLPARLSLGFIGDRFEPRRLLASLYGLSASGTFVLAMSHSYWQAMPYSVLSGLAHGGIVILTIALISDSFGTRRYASIHGVMHTFTILGSISGPVAAGLVFDATGSYRPAFLVVAALLALAAPLILFIKRPQELTTPAPAEIESGERQPPA